MLVLFFSFFILRNSNFHKQGYEEEHETTKLPWAPSYLLYRIVPESDPALLPRRSGDTSTVIGRLTQRFPNQKLNSCNFHLEPPLKMAAEPGLLWDRVQEPIGSIGCTPEDLRNSIRELEDLGRRVKGKKPKILSRIEPLIAGIEQYSKAFDVLSQVSPLALAPLWGSIRLVFQVLRNYTLYIDEVVGMLQKIQLYMPRYREYLQIFPQRERLVKAIERTSSVIKEFCDKVQDIITGTGASESRGEKFKRRIGLAHRPFASVFGHILKEMESQKEEIESEARAAGLKCLVDTNMENRLAFELLTESTHKAENLRQQILDEVRYSPQKANRAYEMRQYLDEADLENQGRYEKLRTQKYQGTCQWLFAKSEFKTWSAKQHGMLCVYGAPGCGKSVLAAACVEKFQLDNPASAPFFFFCDERVATSPKWELILRAWATRTIWKLRSESHLQELVNIFHKRSPASCLSTIHDVLDWDMNTFKTIVVVDALDELEDRTVALSKLQQIALKTRVLVFSRKEPDISTALGCKGRKPCNDTAVTSHGYGKDDAMVDVSTAIAITPNDTRDDMICVVSTWMKTQESSRLLDMILNKTVVDHAEGMFLWLRLVLDDLETSSENDYLKTLEGIPSKLEQYYDRFLSKLEAAANSVERRHMELVFQWAAFSVGPITEESIRQALDFNFGRDTIGAPTVSRIIKRCNPLLQSRSDGRIHVLHLSIREYIRAKKGVIFGGSDSGSSLHGHTALFIICMKYLLISIGDEVSFAEARRDLSGRYSLFEYAARHVWVHLFESGPPDRAKIELLEDFFEKAGKNLFWVEITSLLGLDYRLQDQLMIQSGLRNLFKEYKPATAADTRKIEQIKGGLRSLHFSAAKFSKRKYGRNDLRTAKATHALGSFLYYNGHMREALPYLAHAIRLYKPFKSLNPNDSDYLVLLVEAANCQFDIEPLSPNCVENMRYAYEGSRAAQGYDHPTTLHNGIMLAEFWSCRDKHEKAVPLFLSTLEIATRVLGSDHMTTLRGHHNLAKAYMAIRKYEEAEENFKIVVSRRRRVLGSNHQSTLRSMACLGELYCQISRYEEALELITKGLNGLKEIHGPNNYFVHLATQALGDVRFQQRRFDDALRLYQEAQRGLQMVCGKGSTEVAKILDKSAETCHQMGARDKATRLSGEASRIRLAIEGKSCSWTFWTFSTFYQRSSLLILSSFLVLFGCVIFSLTID